MDFYLH